MYFKFIIFIKNSRFPSSWDVAILPSLTKQNYGTNALNIYTRILK